MQTITSAMSLSAAVFTLCMRFSAASDEGRSLERCEPTMTMGTGEFWTMNERMAAVWCMVSVPWPMTMPWTPFSISRPMASAVPDPLFGSHVFAEDPVQLLGLEIADVGEFRNRAVQLAGREGRDDRPRPVVQPAGDGAPRPEQFHARLLRVEGKFLLGDLVVGFFSARDVIVDALGARCPMLYPLRSFRTMWRGSAVSERGRTIPVKDPLSVCTSTSLHTCASNA